MIELQPTRLPPARDVGSRENQQLVDLTLGESHYLPGGFAPPDPPTRALAGTPYPAPCAWLTRCARSRLIMSRGPAKAQRDQRRGLNQETDRNQRQAHERRVRGASHEIENAERRDRDRRNRGIAELARQRRQV